MSPDKVIDRSLQLDHPLTRYALFLDVDGTLLPIAERPDQVRVPFSLLGTLHHLRDGFLGALALVSGRAIADLDALFEPLALPAAGVHGLELRHSDGHCCRSSNESLLEPLRTPLRAFAERTPGLLLEDKGLSLALHYRLAPEREAEVARRIDELLGGSLPDLEVTQGKMVFEVKPSGCNKGTAIGAFMEEPPFSGRKPIFLGDDITDEDGFVAVNRLDGISVKVGETGASQAKHRLPNEAAVHSWLAQLVDSSNSQERE
ncbi:trehalose-phosphatase [Pelagibius sp.]|uniref:trehalose-phosphatase n=1 Tax=Pelagibius sp. TaxID=1931238 RepID=UPI003BAED919